MSGLARFRESAGLNAWTFRRFGLTPAKLPRRVLGGAVPPVLCVSIPKSGTHLLERAICLHPRFYRKLIPTVSDENIQRWRGVDGLLSRLRPGQVVVSHLRFKPSYPEILAHGPTRGIFLVRDPHDILVSEVHYVAKRKDHRLHDAFARLPDVRDRLHLAIQGEPSVGLPSIGDRLRYFSGWLDSGCLVVRFEDLIGPAGGGDAERQRVSVRSILGHIGAEPHDSEVAAICARLFSSESPTFRRGAIGGWRRLFDEELEALFDRVVGDRIKEYGYGSSG